MDLDDVRTFLAVVESGSFVAATRLLDEPRSTLRRRLEALEAAAGTPLLARSATGAVPTDAGALLAEHGRRLLRQYEAMLDTARTEGATPSGRVTIAVARALPVAAWQDVLLNLHRAHPAMTLHVVRVDDALDALAQGADLGVLAQAATPPAPWRVARIGTVRDGLRASPAYLERHGTPERLEDLSAHHLLAWCAPGPEAAMLPLRDGTTVAVEATLRAPDEALVRVWADAGLGIGLLPLSSGEGLVPVLDHLVGRERPVWWVAPAALASSPRLEAVFEALTDEAQRGGGRA
jgi:DNA-binding transcriptional LysR family regulator